MLPALGGESPWGWGPLQPLQLQEAALPPSREEMREVSQWILDSGRKDSRPVDPGRGDVGLPVEGKMRQRAPELRGGPPQPWLHVLS